MKQVFILGAYGQNNLGDEALLDVFIKQFEGCQLIVNSAQPEVTAKRYGVQCVSTYWNWRPRFSRVRTLLASDLFVFGGGSLLKEIEGNWIARLAYFARILLILIFAKVTGKQTAMLGVGMGPLHYPLYKFLTRVSANLTGVICVRDTDSRDLLRSVGVHREVFVTADPVFTLSIQGRAPVVDQPFAASAAYVAVVPRYSLTEAQQHALAAACDAIVERYQQQILFIPFQTDYLQHFDDTQASRQIQAKMRHPEAAHIWVTDSPRAAFDVIGKATLVLSARLHALIFAAMQGVPSVALSYEVKVRSFMAEAGQSEYSLNLQELENGALLATLDTAWDNRAAIVAQVRERAAVLRMASQRNFDILRAAEASGSSCHLAGGSRAP